MEEKLCNSHSESESTEAQPSSVSENRRASLDEKYLSSYERSSRTFNQTPGRVLSDPGTSWAIDSNGKLKVNDDGGRSPNGRQQHHLETATSRKRTSGRERSNSSRPYPSYRHHRIRARNDWWRMYFDLPETESLRAEYMCALYKKILLQGKMFVFDSYICFHANVFGYVKKKVIDMRDIAIVRKATTAILFNNAVEIIHDGGKREFFTSFLSRDHAYNIIMKNWESCSPYAYERFAEKLAMQQDESKYVHGNPRVLSMSDSLATEELMTDAVKSNVRTGTSRGGSKTTKYPKRQLDYQSDDDKYHKNFEVDNRVRLHSYDAVNSMSRIVTHDASGNEILKLGSENPSDIGKKHEEPRVEQYDSVQNKHQRDCMQTESNPTEGSFGGGPSSVEINSSIFTSRIFSGWRSGSRNSACNSQITSNDAIRSLRHRHAPSKSLGSIDDWKTYDNTDNERGDGMSGRLCDGVSLAESLGGLGQSTSKSISKLIYPHPPNLYNLYSNGQRIPHILSDPTYNPFTIPSSYRILITETMPCSVNEFFSLFWTDMSQFWHFYHSMRGDQLLQATRWKRHDVFGYARDVSFRSPVKGMAFGPKETRCLRTEKCTGYTTRRVGRCKSCKCGKQFLSTHETTNEEDRSGLSSPDDNNPKESEAFVEEEARISMPNPLVGAHNNCVDTSCERLGKDADYIIIESSQTMSDIPYGDSFSVDTRWDIVGSSKDSSRSSVEINNCHDISMSENFTRTPKQRSIRKRSSNAFDTITKQNDIDTTDFLRDAHAKEL